MLLGKRPRGPMMRTASMTEFTVNLSGVEAPVTATNDQNPSEVQEGPTRRKTGVVYPDGYDQRFLATVSPRNRRRNSCDLVETADFLRACGFCKRRLVPGRDIYMYRGDSAFCSLECRQQQMNKDERKEKCTVALKKEDPTTAAGSKGSSKAETVAAS